MPPRPPYGVVRYISLRTGSAVTQARANLQPQLILDAASVAVEASDAGNPAVGAVVETWDLGLQYLHDADRKVALVEHVLTLGGHPSGAPLSTSFVGGVSVILVALVMVSECFNSSCVAHLIVPTKGERQERYAECAESHDSKADRRHGDVLATAQPLPDFVEFRLPGRVQPVK
ncbi:hypothetical protein N657DRAFT_629286 [Parathielavia appendiculata]|uniref:Uncharacterized protein n=1 Tax=Parathielavia appendiculata TaxID=2587402 RepID=A0AAN6Z843_9PEZI|nr:hypothetical protein N657DRAFT_629286 [Parathielavia appendiculata]